MKGSSFGGCKKEKIKTYQLARISHSDPSKTMYTRAEENIATERSWLRRKNLSQKSLESCMKCSSHFDINPNDMCLVSHLQAPMLFIPLF